MGDILEMNDLILVRCEHIAHTNVKSAALCWQRHVQHKTYKPIEIFQWGAVLEPILYIE